MFAFIHSFLIQATSQWTAVEVQGGLPPEPRFDFAFTLIRVKVSNPNYKADSDDVVSYFATCSLNHNVTENGMF